MKQATLSVRLICTLGVMITTGCVSLPERNPLPESLSDEAIVPGIKGARQWADAGSPEIDDWLKLPKEQIKQNYPATYGQEHTYLAISGGGQNGAFGAGLLCGWTDAGTRPEFTMVTGVSTGALIAPFAYLGPEYDSVIREIYTSYSTKDMLEKRSWWQILKGDAATDSALMRELLVKYITADVLAAIAREHARGRMLHVVTTNLDAARPVVWNIGRIAESGLPGSLELVRDILMASAAIPAAFPPVMFEVEANGERYDELHVDGGATSILYLYPIGIDWAEITQKLEVQGKPKVYVLRNGRWGKSYETVKRSTIPIAVRTIDSLMGSVVQGDAYRIYLAAQRDGIDYNLASMPDDFNETASEAFDSVYMNKLFDRGYKLGLEGYQWRKTPPGYDASVR